MARRSKASAQDTAAAERVALIMEMKREGKPFTEIGMKLGISKQAAHTAYWKERARLQDVSVEHSIAIDARRADQAERMEAIIEAWLPRATGAVIDEQTKLAVMDPKAAAIVLKADERLAKLYGLDAPTKTDITSNGQTVVGMGSHDLSSYTDDDLAMLESIHRRVAERKAASEGPGALPAP